VDRTREGLVKLRRTQEPRGRTKAAGDPRRRGRHAASAGTPRPQKGRQELRARLNLQARSLGLPLGSFVHCTGSRTQRPSRTASQFATSRQKYSTASSTNSQSTTCARSAGR
jgi:hypothetical protein